VAQTFTIHIFASQSTSETNVCEQKHFAELFCGNVCEQKHFRKTTPQKQNNSAKQLRKTKQLRKIKQCRNNYQNAGISCILVVISAFFDFAELFGFAELFCVKYL
jgi:predicted secreted protein